MSTPVLSGDEINVLERLYTAALLRSDPDLLKQARKVIDDLKNGLALERVLVPMIEEIDQESQDIEKLCDDLKPGIPRETARGRITGLRFAKNRIARDNVVTVA